MPINWFCVLYLFALVAAAPGWNRRWKRSWCSRSWWIRSWSPTSGTCWLCRSGERDSSASDCSSGASRSAATWSTWPIPMRNWPASWSTRRRTRLICAKAFYWRHYPGAVHLGSAMPVPLRLLANNPFECPDLRGREEICAGKENLLIK